MKKSAAIAGRGFEVLDTVWEDDRRTYRPGSVGSWTGGTLILLSRKEMSDSNFVPLKRSTIRRESRV